MTDLAMALGVPIAPVGVLSLTTLVRDCAASGAARQVALFRSDHLARHLSRPHHQRLARAALEPLLRTDRAIWHELPGGAVAVSWRGDATRQLATARAQLRHLLAEVTPETLVLDDLLHVFALPVSGAALLQLIGVGDGTPDPSQGDAPGDPSGVAPAGVLEAASLAVLEKHLATVDVARFARRSAIFRATGDAAAPAWEKRFLSVTELAATLMPGANMTAVPWLFRRLTRAMDQRVLALLTDPAELARAGPFSLDLNVASILSPEFLRFDAALPPGLRGRVTLNLSPEDLAADVPAFCFARDFARVRCYRLLLRAITHTMLDLWRLDRLAVDLIELQWDPALTKMRLDTIRVGGADWILAHADTPAALAWGLAQGIGLFQGSGLSVTARE